MILKVSDSYFSETNYYFDFSSICFFNRSTEIRYLPGTTLYAGILLSFTYLIAVWTDTLRSSDRSPISSIPIPDIPSLTSDS